MNDKKHFGGVLNNLTVLEATALLKEKGGHIKRPHFEECDYIYCQGDVLHYKDWQFRFIVSSMRIEDVLAADWVHIYAR